MASYTIDFAKSAERDLRKVGTSPIPRLLAEIEALGDAPRPPGVRKLAGSERSYRIRVGKYRIVYEIDDGSRSVLIVRISGRGGVYKKKS